MDRFNLILTFNLIEQPSSEDLDFDDYFVDEERIQVAEEMIDGTTSIPVRHWMLDKLLEWIKIIFKRFGNSLHPDTPGVIKVSDVTAVFRLLQLMENILVTTDNEKPWIEVRM